MKTKKKDEPKGARGLQGAGEGLPELCAAVKQLRLAYNESQELFARRVELAAQTVSRFERGKQTPTDLQVLTRLARAASAKGLARETELFEDAARKARAELGATRPSLSLPAIPIHSLPQWRLMHIAAVAVLYFPETAAAIEQAAATGPAVALVDKAIREFTNRSGIASGLGYIYSLPEVLIQLAEQQAFEAFKDEAKKGKEGENTDA
jgi:transcriptional regulator with XRE-family HTH domain